MKIRTKRYVLCGILTDFISVIGAKFVNLHNIMKEQPVISACLSLQTPCLWPFLSEFNCNFFILN